MIAYIKQLLKEAQEQWQQAMKKIETRELLEHYQVWLKERGFPDPTNINTTYGDDILFSRESLKQTNPDAYQRLERFRRFYLYNYYQKPNP